MVILKTLVGNLSANVNEITFTDNIIDGNSIIEVYYNSNDIYTVETWQREHTIGIVTSDHDFPVSVKVLINNVVAFEPYNDSQVLSQLSDLDGRVTDAEDAISGLAGRVGDAEDDIDALETAITGKQNTLTAGDNITIVNDVISASGGGFSLTLYDHTDLGAVTLNNNAYKTVKSYANIPVGKYLLFYCDTFQRNSNRSYVNFAGENGKCLIYNNYSHAFIDTLSDVAGHSSFCHRVLFEILEPSSLNINQWGNGYNINSANVSIYKIG